MSESAEYAWSSGITLGVVLVVLVDVEVVGQLVVDVVVVCVLLVVEDDV